MAASCISRCSLTKRAALELRTAPTFCKRFVPAVCFHGRELKKFYKNASIVQNNGWYEINLDKRKLRTPLGNLFSVPNESLALAVATEWNAQTGIIRRHTMHLTSLCNTALDNPMHKGKKELIRQLLHFLETDTVCYRIGEPDDLVALECAEWDPLLDWATKKYNIQIEATTGITNPIVPQETLDTLQKYFVSFTDWALFGYVQAVETVKSLLIVLALMERQLSVEQAVRLSQLEVEFQTKKWGNVEWYHNIDRYEVRARLAAATLFVHWCTEHTSLKKKAITSTEVKVKNF